MEANFRVGSLEGFRLVEDRAPVRKRFLPWRSLLPTDQRAGRSGRRVDVDHGAGSYRIRGFIHL